MQLFHDVTESPLPRGYDILGPKQKSELVPTTICAHSTLACALAQQLHVT